MMVSELIKELEKYPKDRDILVEVVTDYMKHWRKLRFELKEISPCYEQDTNIENPLLIIDTIKNGDRYDID